MSVSAKPSSATRKLSGCTLNTCILEIIPSALSNRTWFLLPGRRFFFLPLPPNLTTISPSTRSSFLLQSHHCIKMCIDWSQTTINSRKGAGGLYLWSAHPTPGVCLTRNTVEAPPVAGFMIPQILLLAVFSTWACLYLKITPFRNFYQFSVV